MSNKVFSPRSFSCSFHDLERQSKLIWIIWITGKLKLIFRAIFGISIELIWLNYKMTDFLLKLMKIINFEIFWGGIRTVFFFFWQLKDDQMELWKFQVLVAVEFVTVKYRKPSVLTYFFNLNSINFRRFSKKKSKSKHWKKSFKFNFSE